MYYETYKKLCELKGVRSSEVSRKTGISTATLSSWKNGKYTPGADKLQKIADYFGVSLECYHIQHNDFENTDVQIIETDAHKKDATQTPQKR